MYKCTDYVIGQLEFNTHCLKFESSLPTVQDVAFFHNSRICEQEIKFIKETKGQIVVFSHSPFLCLEEKRFTAICF